MAVTAIGPRRGRHFKVDGVSWARSATGGTMQNKAWAWILGLTITNTSTEEPIGISHIRFEVEREDGTHGHLPQIDDAVRSSAMFDGDPKSGIDLGKNPYLKPRESLSGSLIFIDFQDSFTGVKAASLTLIDTAGETHVFNARPEFLRPGPTSP